MEKQDIKTLANFIIDQFNRTDYEMWLPGEWLHNFIKVEVKPRYSQKEINQLFEFCKGLLMQKKGTYYRSDTNDCKKLSNIMQSYIDIINGAEIMLAYNGDEPVKTKISEFGRAYFVKLAFDRGMAEIEIKKNTSKNTKEYFEKITGLSMHHPVRIATYYKDYTIEQKEEGEQLFKEVFQK